MSSGQYYTEKDAFFVDSSESIKIEVFHYPPANIISNNPPILFIHGLSLAAWVWDNFCRWFSNKGHDCYAMSFRGHGQSTKTPKKDKWWSINDITNDVSAVTDAIIARTGDKPVLVGLQKFGQLCRESQPLPRDRQETNNFFRESRPHGWISSTDHYRFSRIDKTDRLLPRIMTASMGSKKGYISSTDHDNLLRDR
ncbi:16794_t:CDS:2 [Funneliformis mosseae]|uniref:16794_t:CDS:1 n=1 Tax=Funneliformis mosseae TaxID=27381 RepID=A0A9N9BY69_FUNMO|nr:16794_t:CDS:2 [Funneliformis mosseae]